MNNEIKEFYELIGTFKESGYDNSGWREQSQYYEYYTSKRIGYGTYEEMKKLSCIDFKMQFAKDYNIKLLKLENLSLVIDKLDKKCLIKVSTLDGPKVIHYIDIDNVKYKLESILKDDSIFETIYYNQPFFGSNLNNLSTKIFQRIMPILKKHLVVYSGTVSFTDVYKEVSIYTGKRNRAYLELSKYSFEEDMYIIDKYLSDRDNFIYPKPIYDALNLLLEYEYGGECKNDIIGFISNEIIKRSNKNFHINKEYLNSYLQSKISFGIPYIQPKVKRKFDDKKKLLNDIDKVISEYDIINPYKNEILNNIELSIDKYSLYDNITIDNLQDIYTSSNIYKILNTIHDNTTKSNYSHQKTSFEKILQKFYELYPEYNGYNFIKCRTIGKFKLNLNRDSSNIIELDCLYKFI